MSVCSSIREFSCQQVLVSNERLAYGFDVLCLQETITRPENPLELNDSIVIQKHEGRGMAIVIRKGLHSRPKSVGQRIRGTERYSSRKTRPKTQKSLVLVNTDIHPGTASTKTNWDFLEQIEDQTADTIVTCGDFSARSGMWDQQGNNPQRKPLEETLGDVIFIPATTPVPTRLASRQGDTDSTTDLGLVSPRIAP